MVRDTPSVVGEAGIGSGGPPAAASPPAVAVRIPDAAGILIANLVLAVALLGASWLGIVLAHARAAEVISALAPASGLALAAVMLGGYRMLPGVFVGAVLTGVTTSLPALAVLGLAVGDTAAAFAGVLALRLVRFRPTLERLPDAAALILLGGLVASLLGVGIAFGAAVAAGVLHGSEAGSAWWVWLLGDTGGTVLVGGGLLMAAVSRRPNRRDAIELAVGAGVIVVAASFLLGFHHGFGYLVYPLLLVLAVVCRQRGAALGGLLVLGIGLWFTVRSRGGFAVGSADWNLARAQAFALVATSVALFVGAVMEERRSAADAVRRLAESQHALAEAQRLASIGSFELDLRTGTTTWSDELYRMLGADSAWFRPGLQAWRERIHPDDRERVNAILQEAYDTRGSWVFVIRINRFDGVVRILECRGRVEVDEGGRPIRIVGTGQDVTGAKMAEERIRSLFENAPYAIVIVDETGGISLVNTAAEQLFGYDGGDVLGLPVDWLLPAREGAGAWYRRPIAGDPVAEAGLCGRRRDGSEFPIEISLSPVDTEEGALLSIAVRDVTERKQAADALAHQASHDPLTGLPNRALFLDRLEHALARARRSAARIAVMFLDLDDFKLVNDTRGHDVGDLLLLALAPRLNAALRPGDTIARFGGDEFVVLCEDLADEQAAVAIAERMAEACSRPVRIEGMTHTITVSAGVAVTDDVRDTAAHDLLRDADAAMYRAKAGGKGRIEVFDEGMRARLIERVAIESDLRQALERDELRLLFQPVISLRDNRIVGAEALLRWQHPERGLLEPAAFMPVAESSGLIVPIGAWVLEQACRHASTWSAGPGAEPICVSVNLSPRQLVHSDITRQIAGTLQSTGLEPSRLELEITETTLLEDRTACARIIGELKALGVRIVLDDFGTGYSSLSYLKRLTIDALKIDRSFVGGLGRDTEDGAIVSAVLSIASALDVGVTAEGIETLAQLARLRAQGCEFGQGFLFSQPASGEVVGEMIGTGAQPSAAALRESA